MLLDWAVDSGMEVGINDAGVLECELRALLAGAVRDQRLSAVGWVQLLSINSLSDSITFASWESGNVFVMLLGLGLYG